MIKCECCQKEFTIDEMALPQLCFRCDDKRVDALIDNHFKHREESEEEDEE